jgi:Domain of unknown function (DUF4190)
MTQPQVPSPPQYGYGYPPPPRRPTNSMAVAALITALLVPPVGVVLGVLARNQVRQTGEDGDGLALAGIVIGICLTLLYVLLIAFFVLIFKIAADTAVEITENLPTFSPTPSPTPG